MALLAGFVVWRLSAGPLSLDALTPYVARSIAPPEAGLVARVDHTLLSLGPGGTLEILARGVHFARQDGGAELSLPELAMGFSPGAALRGVLAPTLIVLDGPELRLERSADGTFRLDLGATGAEVGDWTRALLKDLASPPTGRGPLGYLNEVAIRHAALTVDDRALGVAWHAERADAILTRGARAMSGKVALIAIEPGGVEAELRGGFTLAYGENRLAARVSFTGLKPALFADAAPSLAPLRALNLPLSGEVRLALDTATLRISGAGCNLTFGAGALVHPALEGGQLAIASGELRAEYDPQAGRVSIERLGVDLGGPRAELSGTVAGVGAGILAGAWPRAVDVAGDLRLSKVPADSLAGYWPEQLSPHSREWVTQHIHDGLVTEADARFGAHVDLDPDASKPVRVDTFAGTFAYRGLTVDYFKPLEPLRGVDGTATFDRAHLDLVPSSGRVKGVQLTGGAAKLTQLDTNDEQIAMEFGVKGPLRDVLQVLDSKPLE
ncbi:MAG TPA: DUF3971 domain-containing protein [Stellaceae bacterium]|nr:DUF3971 domain-containing protein [Stellaceae bacterium]